MPTFYIPIGEALTPTTSAGGAALSGVFVDPVTAIPLAIPQFNAPNILQRWTLLSIYAPYVIQNNGLSPMNFQLGISALINETPVWAQQANGQLFGSGTPGPVSTSQILAGDLFNPLELNAGQKLTFAWQLVFDVALGNTGRVWIGANFGLNGIQPVQGVVNYDVAYSPALPGRAAG